MDWKSLRYSKKGRHSLMSCFFHCLKIFIFRSNSGHFWTRICSKIFRLHWKRHLWSDFVVFFVYCYSVGKCPKVFFYCLKILICRSYLWHIWPKIWSKIFVAHQKRCGSSHICVCFIITCVNAQEWFLIFLIFLFLGHISGIFGLKIG